MTADGLDVGPAHGGDDALAGAAVDAVDLAGDKRLERERAILDLQDVDREPAPGWKSVLRRHHHEAGVALERDDAVTPRFQRLRGRYDGEADRKHRRDRDRKCQLATHGRPLTERIDRRNARLGRALRSVN